MKDSLLPIKQASGRLGISIWTLRKLAYAGKIDSVKIGAKLLISETEVARIISNGLRSRKLC